MKHIYALFAALLVSSATFAQLPSGAAAPDWTATDLDGVEHNLYSMLDSGYTVVIDFSATWCGPCWNYHNTGALETLWEEHGPDGDNTVRVFFIEGDDTTTQADLEGTGGATQGDWISGTGYPIIDNGGDIFDDYFGAYFPTIYTICPNKLVTESGQITASAHAALIEDFCANTEAAPFPATAYTGELVACGAGEWAATAYFVNFGVPTINDMTISVTFDGAAQPDVTWSGEMNSYDELDVDLGMYSGGGELVYEVTSINGEAFTADEYSSRTIDVSNATGATSLIEVAITTDGWGEETGWSIFDENGTVIESVATGTLDDQTDYVWFVSVPSTGCYSFEITDAYGDGLFGSQWGSPNGSCAVRSYDDNIAFYSTIYDYDGSYNFSSEERGMEVVTMNVGVEEVSVAESLAIFPNPTSGTTQLNFNLAEAQPVVATVFNLVGEVVMTENFGTLSAGEQREVIDFSGFNAGVYLVSVQAGDETSTLRVTVQ
jgi:hypothetical protein